MCTGITLAPQENVCEQEILPTLNQQYSLLSYVQISPMHAYRMEPDQLVLHKGSQDP
jgi:hypothetical protein